MIAEGTDAGVFHAAERELLEGVIHFADRPLRGDHGAAARHRWLDVDDPFETILAEVLASGHSRFPLCAGDDRRADRLPAREGHPPAAALGRPDLRAVAARRST